MKLSQYFCTVCCVIFIFLSGCTFEEDLAGSQDMLYPVTALKAASFDSTSVLLTWVPSPNDSISLFQKYQLFWTYANSADSSLVKPDSVDLLRGTSSYRVTGLTQGVEYLFTLYTIPQDFAVRPYTSIRWAPAMNYGVTTLPNQNVLEIYDATHTPTGPSVINLDDPRAQASGDLYLESDLTLRSTSDKGTGWRRTLFSTTQIQASDVPLPMTSFPSVSTFIDSVVSLQPQVIYFCKTQDGHYARLYVKNIPPAFGTKVFVNLDISYQSTANLPYAKRTQ